MKHSVTELVNAILAKIDENPSEPHNETRIRSWLAGEGYPQRDIDAAIKLVRPRFEPQRHVSEYRPGSIRLLSLFEAHKLTPAARDALARLDMYELIEPFEREMLLERLDHFDGEIGLEELDYLLAWIVTGGRDVEYRQTMSQILEGKGDMLH